MMKKIAIAPANIALVKYWGKRDEILNLPATGSLSITLKDLYTRTSVEFRDNLTTDQLVLNSNPGSSQQTNRVTQFLDILRKQAGTDTRAEIISENNFPTGAGLASSASGFAALAMAAAHAIDIPYTPEELSRLARQGSGSAARSIYGGFVEMKPGEKADGSDSIAVKLYKEDYWPLDMLILLTSETAKEIGSTDGMNHTRETSPYYQAWVDSSATDIKAACRAISEKDFSTLGEIAEYSCLKMHALALSANPGIMYWNALSVTLMQEVRKLRKKGLPAYFTIDAGPQIKVLCLPEHSQQIRKSLAKIDGIKKIWHTTIGPGARLETAD